MSLDKMKILFVSCLIGVLADDMMTSSSPPLTSPHVVSTSTGGQHGTDHGHTDTTSSYGHHETTMDHETEVPMDHEEPVPLGEGPVPVGPPCEECISIRRTPGEPHHLTGEYRQHFTSQQYTLQNKLLAGDSTMALNVPPVVPTSK